jgi:hypothetical protein
LKDGRKQVTQISKGRAFKVENSLYKVMEVGTWQTLLRNSEEANMAEIIRRRLRVE